MTKETKTGEEIDYVVIRRYNPQDYEQLNSLAHEVWAESRSRNFYSPMYLVAENQNRILGAVSCRQQKRYVELGDLAVGVRFRRQGIAAALIQTAEETAIAKGRKEIRLNGPIEDEKMVSFYESLGFAAVCRTKDGVVMIKSLQDSSKT